MKSRILEQISEKIIIGLFLMMTTCFVWVPEKSIFLCPLILLIGCFIYDRIMKKVTIFQTEGHLICMFILGVCTFILRFIYWFSMRGSLQQIGEVNKIILDSAVNGDYTGVLVGFDNYPDKAFYFRMFPHKLCYPAFLHVIGLRDQDSIILFQIICAVITTILIYKIGRRMISSRGGVIAGILYALWPAQIVYQVFISEENISIVVSLLSILFIIKIKDNILGNSGSWGGNKVSTIGCAILVGIISGICVYFKDWCLVIIIASIWVVLMHTSGHLIDKKLLTSCGILILFFRGIVRAMVIWKLEELLQATVNTDNLACYAYVSLHPWNDGGYNPARYKEYFELVIKNEWDFDKANLIALKHTVTNVMGTVKRLPGLLTYKLYQGYHDDLHMFNNAIGSIIDVVKKERYSPFFYVLKQIDLVYWMTIVSGGIYAAISELEEKNKTVLWFILILVGGLLLILLIECEGRYKYCIQPIWLLTSVWGMRRIATKVRKWKTKENEIQA